MPEALRAGLAAAIDDGFKQDQARQTDAAKREVARKIYEAVASTVKAGELQLAAGLLGPNAAGKYTFAAGLKVMDADRIETLIRGLIPSIPDESTRKMFAFDAETVDGVKIHRAKPKLDTEPRRLFGEDATVLFAFPAGAFVVAGGAEPGDPLKQLFAVSETTGGPIWAEASAARFAGLDRNNADRAKKAATATFGSRTHADMVRLSLDGGPSLRLRLTLKGQILSFLAKLNGGGNFGSP